MSEQINMSPEHVTAMMRRGPFHEWLGIEVVAVGEDEIELIARWRKEWVVNVEGDYTHGGILAALVDLTADWALYSRIGRGVPTVDMRVDYHRPAKSGDLRVKGNIVKAGGRLSVAEARVYDMEGQLLASGRGVYATNISKG
jgi:uncharacterized protein (TIGR00369 family)